MMNNNLWMYLVMLALFGGGNWGFGNRGGVGPGVAALDIETQNKLNSLQAQINDNNNNQWAREATQGNTFAISQLSQNLGVNYNALFAAIDNVKDAILQVGAHNGMGFAGVTNSINLDTKYAEKQELENRIKKLEDGNAETNKLLNQILSKLK